MDKLVGMEGFSYPGQDVQRSDQTIHRRPFCRVCAHGVPAPEWNTVDTRAVPCRHWPRRRHMHVGSWVHVAGDYGTPAASKPQGLADVVQLLWDAGHVPLISPSCSSPPSLISFICPCPKCLRAVPSGLGSSVCPGEMKQCFPVVREARG